MELSERDINILKLVGIFSQLSTPHLRNLVFYDRSHSVADVVLNRLVKLKYLARVGKRASEERGGTSPWVYQLGQFGRALFEIQARPATHPSRHALMIADTFIALREAQALGLLQIRRWDVALSVPPVRADLFVALDFPAQQRESKYFLEIDLGNESRSVILEKLRGYWQVADQSTEEFFPYVVFVTRNQAVANQLKGYIRNAPEEQQEMTRVFTLAELIPQLAQL